MNKINSLLAEVNNLAIKVQEVTDHAVFIRFSGHVDQLEIEIAESKENYSNKLVTYQIYTDREEEKTTKELARVKSKLEAIVADGEIDFSKLKAHYTL